MKLALRWVIKPLATMAVQLGQQLLNRQIQLFILLRQFLARRLQIHDGGRLLDQQRLLLDQQCISVVEQRLVARQSGGQFRDEIVTSMQILG